MNEKFELLHCSTNSRAGKLDDEAAVVPSDAVDIDWVETVLLCLFGGIGGSLGPNCIPPRSRPRRDPEACCIISLAWATTISCLMRGDDS